MTETRRSHRAVPARSALRAAVAGFLALVFLGAAGAMVATWPSGVHEVAQRAGLVDAGAAYMAATVRDTAVHNCAGTIEDVQADGTVPETVPCVHVRATVTSGPARGQRVEVIAPSTTSERDVPAGTRIIVERYPAVDGMDETWAWSDFARAVPLGALSFAFVVVAALVAGWRGLRAVLGLAVAAVVLWVYLLPALITGEPPLVVGLAASVVIMTAVVYLAHGVSMRSTAALLGTFAGLLLVLAVGALASTAAHLSYVSTEEDYRLAGLLGDDGVATLRGVFMCGVLLAGLGVLNDVTITQASAVWELRAADPTANWRALVTGGMRIGRDHIASTIYTIAFAYAGASLPVLLLLQLYEQPVLRTLTSGVFAEEIVRTMAGAIGLVLAIPFTTAIAAWLVARFPGRSRQADAAAH